MTVFCNKLYTITIHIIVFLRCRFIISYALHIYRTVKTTEIKKQSYLTLIIGWARDFLNFLLFIDSMKQIKYIVGWIQTYAILGYKLSIYIRTRPQFFNYEIWIKNMREKPSLDPPPGGGRGGYDVVIFPGGGGVIYYEGKSATQHRSNVLIHQYNI